jgi:hypothetical protein
VDYKNSKMLTLWNIESFFTTKGTETKRVPKSVIQKISHPRNNAIYWLIGESEVYQDGPKGKLVATRDENVVEMMSVFL